MVRGRRGRSGGLISLFRYNSEIAVFEALFSPGVSSPTRPDTFTHPIALEVNRSVAPITRQPDAYL